jgi:hypothetical protein
MKTVLVIGRAQGTWREVDAANTLVGSIAGPFDEVVAINDAGHDFPRVDHWVSFHGDKFERWMQIRKANGFDPVAQLWTSTYGRKESAYERKLGALGVRKVTYTGGGSSGLVATIVALVYLQATHIVLAGIPMVSEAGHYNEKGDWKEAVKHRSAWRDQLHNLKPNVRSMSGWTADELGIPDKQWLMEDHPSRVIKL